MILDIENNLSMNDLIYNLLLFLTEYPVTNTLLPTMHARIQLTCCLVIQKYNYNRYGPLINLFLAIISYLSFLGLLGHARGKGYQAY